tara:strand:- start:477 stop:845 length:369 start_codon:yes stop_codon:yes gene_type:complete
MANSRVLDSARAIPSNFFNNQHTEQNPEVQLHLWFSCGLGGGGGTEQVHAVLKFVVSMPMDELFLRDDLKNKAIRETNLLDGFSFKWRGPDLNRRPRGYEPRELPGCSTPRYRVFCPVKPQK